MGDYVGETPAESQWGRGNNGATLGPTNVEPVGDASKPEATVVAKRENRIYTKRKCQIGINLLSLAGGVAYITARLSRFPGEDRQLFAGGATTKSGQKIDGRREQAHCMPYMRRFVDKLAQYIFSNPIKRDGADPKVLKDIDREGGTIGQLMRKCNDDLTCAGWGWLMIASPVRPETVTEAEAATGKYRVYWQHMHPLSVVDWHYDSSGELEWLLYVTSETHASDPLVAAESRKVRVLWTRGELRHYVFDKDGNDIETVTSVENPYGIVPFVGYGTISPEPILADSLEGIMRTIMDLESCSRQNYFETVFPTIILPESLKSNKQTTDGRESTEQKIGLHTALHIAPGDVIPQTMSPDAGPLESVRSEINELVQAFWTIAGMAMRKSGRQAESAEAKAWDHLDIQQGLRERALELANIEDRANVISKKIDTSWKEWTAEYPQDFTIRDLMAELDKLILLGQTDLPEEIERERLIRIVEVLDLIGSRMTDERKQQLLDAAKEAKVTLPVTGAALPDFDVE